MTASLDIHASNVSPLEYDCKDQPKVRRHALRVAAGKILLGERVAACGRKALGGAVAIHQASTGHHFSGIETCGSVWTCPVCAAKITEGRRAELDTLLNRHHAAGGHAFMLTLTVRHHAGQSCAELRSLVADTWRYVKQGAPWKRIVARSGYLGDVRALEVTHGGNGWHPHLHILVLFKRQAEAEQFDYFAGAVFERWARRVEDKGYGFCSADAFRFDVVTPGTGAADYVGKWGAAMELTKAHTKRAKSGGRTPWQILADFEAQGDTRDRRLFAEYARTFKGARQLTWSRGIRAHYGLTEEVEDAELAQEPTLPETHIASITRPLWVEVSRRHLTGRLLVALDQSGPAGAVALMASHGLHITTEMHPSLETGRHVPWLFLVGGEHSQGHPGISEISRNSAPGEPRGAPSQMDPGALCHEHSAPPCHDSKAPSPSINERNKS